MKVTMVILFLMGGEWEMVDGWYPRVQPDYDTCMQRAYNVSMYIAESFPNETAAVSCEIAEDK